MNIITTKPFDRDYVQMEDPRGIWEASITMSYRFTFMRDGDTIILRRVGTHDIFRNP